MGRTFLDFAVLAAATGVGLALIRLGQSLWKIDSTAPVIRVRGDYSPVLTWLRYHRLPGLIWQAEPWLRVRSQLWVLGELSLIAVWAAWFGQNFLNLNPQLVPMGNEFAMGIQSNYIWTLLGRCGACVFWNGFTNGGVPAFADLHGAALHPLVMTTTLLWDTVNGAKVTVLASLALAGLAQWWLARAMRLGRLARLWSAGLAIVSGAVAGRMEIGLVPLALSVAMSALVLAGGVALALDGRRRTAVVLGGLMALLILSGQGYLQLGMLLSVLPAGLVIWLVGGRGRLTPVWKEFLAAGALAVLLSAVLWVPVAHFWPNLGKNTDPGFQSAQPALAAMLNLIINNAGFYHTTALGKQPYPYLYVTYIGIVPVLLALAAVRLVPRQRRRLLFFFLTAFVLVYLAASAESLRMLELVLPQLAPLVRNPSLISALAVPLVLALAGWSVDLLLQLDWPRLILPPWTALAGQPRRSLSVAALALVLPLAWSLKSAYDFNRSWLATTRLLNSERRVVAALKTLSPAGQAEWLQPPWGENGFLIPAMDAGFKIASYFRPWYWSKRITPAPFAEAVRVQLWPGDPTYAGGTPGVSLALHLDRPYAVVSSKTEWVPCQATALAGDIDVTCDSPEAGQLVVQENAWTGWSVRMDNRPASLTPADWLTTNAPAGQHTFTFRYRPWDVPLGIGLTLVGLAAAILLWRRSPE